MKASAPMSTDSYRKRDRTRAHLAEVAMTLFEEHGFGGVTMEQIAAAAGVARGTLYNHFAVKEAALVHAVHARLAGDIGPLLQQVIKRRGLKAQLTAVFKASADWWEAHRDYAAPYIRFRFQTIGDGQAGQGDSDMQALYAQLIARAQDGGEIRNDIASGRLASHLHFLYLGAVLRWLENDRITLARELAGVLAFFMDAAKLG